jgi:glycosyltransferase involved in cell wall biosynthesis
LKILLICEAVFPENKGGIERWFQELAHFLQSNDNEVTYFNSSNINETRDGIRFVTNLENRWTYLEGGVRSKAQALRFGISLYRWLRNEKFDVIYCSSVPIFSVLALLLVKNLKSLVMIEWAEVWSLRYWVRYSGAIQGLIGWLLQIIAIQAGHHRITLTEGTKDKILKWSFINKKEVQLLPGLCRATEDNTPINLVQKKQDIYFLGRFVNEKQPKLAIDCVEAFMKTGWKGKFWLLGTGPLVHELRAIINRRKLEETIILLNNPTDIEVEKIASKSFVLLHPSRREGYGLASVEAAFRGVPSILISYPDNATVSLGISPKLVAKDGEVSEIVKLLTIAWKNQEKLTLETLNWAQHAQLFRSSLASCQKIQKIALESYQSR